MKILITGPSGSGKTTIAARAKELGYHSYDSDEVADLADWRDAQGNRVVAARQLDSEFLDTHEFLWCPEALDKLLHNNQQLLLFGISRNAFRFASKFDRIYFLEAPAEILAARLLSPTRENPMGQQPHHLDYCLRWAAINKTRAMRVGAVILDATKSADSLIAEITA